MDNLPTEILIRIFDKSRLSDQLISHRLINTKFRELVPTKASRVQRVDTTDLVAVSKRLALFSQKDCAYHYHSRWYFYKDPEIERAYANLLLYVCNLSGASLKCISFTTPLLLGSIMEELAWMCPRITEIKVGSADPRGFYLGGNGQLLFNDVYQALPLFPELKILRIIARGNTAFLQPIVAQLRLQKLHTSGVGAPVLTADPSLLEELVVSETSGGPYPEIRYRICAVFPNLRRYYFQSKQYTANERIRPGEAEANYRRLHMLRASSWIGGRNLWFIDERLFLDFPYLQSMNIEISDDASCDRVIRALQSSGNWKVLNMDLSALVSAEKCVQLLQALCYTTADRLKSLTLTTDFGSHETNYMQQFLDCDKADNWVVFDKTLRHCNITGSGMLLLVAKIANACSQMKSLKVKDSAKYMEPESGLQELLEIALTRFEQANLSSLLQLSLSIAHSAAYNIIQCLRGSRLYTMQLHLQETDCEISDAHCSSLLREDMFLYLRMLNFATYNEGMLFDIMLNIVRNLPALRSLGIQLPLHHRRSEHTLTVDLEQTVWRHIAQHTNLQFCSVHLNGYGIFSENTFMRLYNIIARKKVDENGRLLPWLYMELHLLDPDHVQKDAIYHQGENAYCLVQT